MLRGVLIIEDEITLAKNIQTYLERHQYDVRTAETAQAGLELCTTFQPDVVLLDLHLPDQHGLEVLPLLQQHNPQIVVIIITAHESVRTAVQAMQLGAYDYLSKPLVLRELKLLLEKAGQHLRLEGALTYYQAQAGRDSHLTDIIGNSEPMQALKAQIDQLLQAEHAVDGMDLPAVLIIGETGTGKELVARALHYNGPRRNRPMIEINCASIPDQLLEAELFGYEAGAFTDAKGRKLGLFETAEGGTVFLDEIGDMDVALQAKLLRVLEDKMLRRVGGLRNRKINVRIIAATNQPLETLVQQGKFRADLYYRLCVFQLTVPPLRARHHDILLLAQHFIHLHGRHYNKLPLQLSPDAENVLLRHTWPGNVRELRNVLEQAVLLATHETITPRQFPLLVAPLVPPGARQGVVGRVVLPPHGLNIEEVEQDLVQQALARTAWNVTKAAKLLAMSRDMLRYRIEKYQLQPPQRESHAATVHHSGG
jgi:DNA-binding NtrC family response regulator